MGAFPAEKLSRAFAWACLKKHTFLVQKMLEHAPALARTRVGKVMPLGNDSWTARRNGGVMLQCMHTDIDYVLGDGQRPLLDACQDNVADLLKKFL
jgi:hypothetical protein